MIGDHNMNEYLMILRQSLAALTPAQLAQWIGSQRLNYAALRLQTIRAYKYWQLCRAGKHPDAVGLSPRQREMMIARGKHDLKSVLSALRGWRRSIQEAVALQELELVRSIANNVNVKKRDGTTCLLSN
jgi:hypothetical protein